MSDEYADFKRDEIQRLTRERDEWQATAHEMTALANDNANAKIQAEAEVERLRARADRLDMDAGRYHSDREEYAQRLEELDAEVDRLRATVEANEAAAVGYLHDLGAARDKRDEALAEVEQLRATLAQVEKLADNWEAIPYDKRTPYDEGWHDALDHAGQQLRDALRGERS